MSTNNYNKLYEAYRKRYENSLSKAAVQKLCNESWEKLKGEFGKQKDELHNAVDTEVKKLLTAATDANLKRRTFFAQVRTFMNLIFCIKPCVMNE